MSAESSTLRIELTGANPPGRTFERFQNVHVGLQRKTEVVDRFPGDSPNISWTVEVETKSSIGGGIDFRGPCVHGKPGERFIYVSWGDVAPGGDFAMFRRAKVMLNAIDPRLLQMASAGGTLSGRFELTDTGPRPGPASAALRPPKIEWTVTVG